MKSSTDPGPRSAPAVSGLRPIPALSSWEPLMLGVTAPGDAARMALEFGATAGAVLEVYALDLK